MIYCGVPTDPQTILTRDHTARALTDSGFPVEVTSLAVFASEGRGPAYFLHRFNGSGRWRACYRWGDAIAWAKAHRRYESPSDAEARRAM